MDHVLVFDAPLKPDIGNYHLRVSDGQRTYHGYRTFGGAKILPCILSTGFHAYRNDDESLLIT